VQNNGIKGEIAGFIVQTLKNEISSNITAQMYVTKAKIGEILKELKMTNEMTQSQPSSSNRFSMVATQSHVMVSQCCVFCVTRGMASHSHTLLNPLDPP
jgi:hypothetical protein